MSIKRKPQRRDKLSSLWEWPGRSVLANDDFRAGLFFLPYLAAIILAESLITYVGPQPGLFVHCLLLFVLLVHAALRWGEPGYQLVLSLTLVPLIRIVSLTLPLSDFTLVYWYLIISIPLFLALLLVIRMLNYSWQDMGLVARGLPWQLVIGLTGIVFGFIEYRILRPDPLVDEFTLEVIWLPALILLTGTGFFEELLFRGVLQKSAMKQFGKFIGVVAIAFLFAVLHIGYKSLADFVFVLIVALFYGAVVARTGSLIGVGLSHGITNISLFLVWPFLLNTAT